MNKPQKYLALLVAALITLSLNSYAESIDDMRCQSSAGFSDRLGRDGYRRVMTLPFGWGGYDTSTSHNINGSSVRSYEIRKKNQWALYATSAGAWKLFQGVSRKNLSTGREESLVCEVESGHDLTWH